DGKVDPGEDAEAMSQLRAEAPQEGGNGILRPGLLGVDSQRQREELREQGLEQWAGLDFGDGREEGGDVRQHQLELIKDFPEGEIAVGHDPKLRVRSGITLFPSSPSVQRVGNGDNEADRFSLRDTDHKGKLTHPRTSG